MVVGATVTKLFLSPKQFGVADTVIIDEASMVLAPALFHAAGMASARVVVCGDFRQLPPISGTTQKVLFDLLGRDIFDLAGVRVNPGGRPTSQRLKMLDTQHRMCSEVCDLIAGPMYDGRLLTGARSVGKAPPPPFDARITVVDTSSLYPFVGFDETGSRFNLMHAVVVRNIVRHLSLHGVHEVGVTAGYRAQTRVIRHFLEDAGCSHCMVGTVHRFQGDEKHVMILDLPEGQGDYGVGRFLHGESPDDVGPRLLNVAVSRARDHLVFVLNRAFLDRKLPGNAVIREILYRAQESGRVLDAADVLAMEPLLPGKTTSPGSTFGRTPLPGLYSQDDFAAALRADLAGAHKSVIIFSGFITANRGAQFGEDLRRLVARGVKVRCVTRPPRTNMADTEENTSTALEALRGIGCAVDLRTKIHQKVVVIDESILWLGSLNPLSFTEHTQELMVRTQGEESAREVLEKLALPKVARIATHFHEAENPPCGSCGGLTVWHQKGRTRMFFCVNSECSWKVFAEKAWKNAPLQRNGSFLADGPPCSECGGPTVLRNSRRGPFYGCKSYPKCKGIARVSQ